MGKYWLGRISISLLKEVLPDVLLKQSRDDREEKENLQTDHNETNLGERRLCCICGPIPFMKEANRYLKKSAIKLYTSVGYMIN